MQILDQTHLAIDEAAEMLGVTTRTVYKYIEKKKISHTRRGRSIFFLREDLENFLKRVEVAQPTIPQSANEPANA